MAAPSPNKVLYIGIGGKKRHGKDTVATFLFQHSPEPWGRSVRRALAESLKEEVACFLCSQFQGNPEWDRDPQARMEQIMDALMSGTPEEKEPFRLLLQWWGTEYRRGMCGEDYWIKELKESVDEWVAPFDKLAPFMVVVPDVRMPNECRFIRDQGGLLIKVVRSGMEDADPHASETALDAYAGWDTIIPNEGTLEELSQQVRIIREGLVEERLREMKASG